MYPGLISGESAMKPMGTSPPSLSSQVMKSAPPFRYALEPRICGTACESQVSPFLIASELWQPELSCMSLQMLGVMKLYCGTAPVSRSWVSSV